MECVLDESRGGIENEPRKTPRESYSRVTGYFPPKHALAVTSWHRCFACASPPFFASRNDYCLTVGCLSLAQCHFIIAMPTKRARKNPSVAQKPPSPPLSEKNAVITQDIPEEEGAKRESTLRDESYTPELFDEDEEMPEETENTIDPDTGKAAKRTAEYALGGGGYNALKSYKGQMYSGMAVGGSHTWTYDQGTWKETKEEPDLWRIDYQTNKRRARKAPTGSGAPVGTEYHWLIVGHQVGYATSSDDGWLTPTACEENRCQYVRDAPHRLEV